MFITLKRLLEWILLVLVFFIFTFLMYRFVLIANTWIEPDQYKEPKGHSIKVDEMGDPTLESSSQLPSESMLEQLKLFYWYGQ
ncbi:DUF4227 family protein [Tepidibacillus marianensis]|uniref:DUF4227 family protein n=1 Tax=Tepidibacillus marianensis TaxID=3131995 RepID=UPI0030CC2924